MTEEKQVALKPKVGYYGVLGDGTVHGPIFEDYHPRDGYAYWVGNELNVDPDGKGLEDRDNLVALITPEAMAEAIALSSQPSQEELSQGRVLSRFEWDLKKPGKVYYGNLRDGQFEWVDLYAENVLLREALQDLLSASEGFVEAVRQDSNLAYPWPALDLAVPKAKTALLPVWKKNE